MSSDEAMKIIENYLERVRENLPNGLDGDIIEELRSHLLDMVYERGGLTVENAKWAVEKMGDPVKLAEEIAREEGYFGGRKKRFEITIKWGDKSYRWGFELSEDLMDNLFKFITYFVLVVLFFAVFASATVIFAYGNFSEATSLIWRAIWFMISAVILVHVAMWVFSELGFEPSKKSGKKPIVKKVIERREIPLKPRPSYAKVGGYLVGGLFEVAFGIFIIWVVWRILNITFVSRILYMSLALALIYRGVVSFGKAIYLALEGVESVTLDYISAFSALIMVPSLIFINLYPEQLQIPILETNGYSFDEEGISKIVDYIKLVNIPVQYLTIVQIIALLLIVTDIVYILLKTTIYSRAKRSSAINRLLKRS